MIEMLDLWFYPAVYLFLHVHFIFKDMKWIEEKQALYRRNQELVEKVRLTCPGAWPVP